MTCVCVCCSANLHPARKKGKRKKKQERTPVELDWFNRVLLVSFDEGSSLVSLDWVQVKFVYFPSALDLSWMRRKFLENIFLLQCHHLPFWITQLRPGCYCAFVSNGAVLIKTNTASYGEVKPVSTRVQYLAVDLCICTFITYLLDSWEGSIKNPAFTWLKVPEKRVGVLFAS